MAIDDGIDDAEGLENLCKVVGKTGVARLFRFLMILFSMFLIEVSQKYILFIMGETIV